MSDTAAAPPPLRTFDRYWMLIVILLVAVSGSIDRTILSTLGQAIKQEMRLTDAQLGWMIGPPFAIFYAALGLPIARIAERKSRTWVIAASVLVWSVMTTFCGFAQGFAQMFLFRIGVGVGEAGGQPASASLISDYFPPIRRPFAFAIYGLGIPLGSMIGGIGGGWVAQHYGWRAAFFWVGVPGLILAALAAFTVKEAPRGHSEGVQVAAAPPSLAAAIKLLWAKRSFRNLLIGAALANLATNGILPFTVPFLVRTFHLPTAKAGLLFGIVSGVAGGLGALAGGYAATVMAKRDRRWYMFTPAIGLLLAAPVYWVAFSQGTYQAAAAVLFVAVMFHFAYTSPTYATAQNFVEPRMRASVQAILGISMTLVGSGLGPVLSGMVSDRFATRAFTLGEYARLCPGGRPSEGALPMLVQACGKASATGVQQAMMCSAVLCLWAMVHYLLASRNLREDLTPAAAA